MAAKTNAGPGLSVRNSNNSGTPQGVSPVQEVRNMNYNDNMHQLSEPLPGLIQDAQPLKTDYRQVGNAKVQQIDPKTLGKK